MLSVRPVPSLLRLLGPRLRMAALSLLMGLVVLGRVVSPVGGSLMMAAADGPVFLGNELCLTAPEDGSPLTGSAAGAGDLSTPHDCCWWMSGVPALVLVVLAAVLLLLPQGRQVWPAGWTVRMSAPPRRLWRFACPSRAPPSGGSVCFFH